MKSKSLMNDFLVATVGPLKAGRSGPLRPRGEVDPFATLPANIVHPPGGNERLFGFRARPDGVWEVPAPALLGCFDSPTKGNLLFCTGPRTQEPLLLVGEDGAPLGGTALWYRPCPAPVPGLAFPPADLAYLGGQFFRQVETRPPGPFVRQLVRAGTPAEDHNCWLNPVLLRLPEVGREAWTTDPNLSPFFTNENVLFAVRLPDPDEVVRLLTWHELRLGLAAAGRAPSTVEALVFSSRLAEGGLAFHALDALGGTFLVNARGPGPARYAWCPPADACSTNAQWFADYWRRRWHGAVEAHPPADLFSRQLPAEEALTGRPAGTTASEPVPEAAVAACTASARALLRLSPWAGAGPASPAGLLARLLDRPEVRGSDADTCHRGHFELAPDPGDGRRRFLLDVVGLADRFARRFLLPRSAVWLTLPAEPALVGGHPAQARAVADSIRTAFAGVYTVLADAVPLAGYEVLRRLAGRLAAGPAPRPGPLPYRFGWWEDWFDSLFMDAGEEGTVLCVPETGLVLGRSALGLTPLGWAPPGYVQHRHVRL
jgi:hypothetical protein